MKAEYAKINKLDKEKIRTKFKPSRPEDGSRDRYNNIRPYSHNIVRSKSKTGQKKKTFSFRIEDKILISYIHRKPPFQLHQRFLDHIS